MIGFTAPIPLEILVAAGRQPVDLNQLFLNSDNQAELIEEAELAGFHPHASPWIKGLYGTILRHGIRDVIAVTTGHAEIRELIAILELHGVRVIPFSYPFDRSGESLALEIKKLARYFGASPVVINQARRQLNQIRAKVHAIDRLNWKENRVNSRDSFSFQLATADMKGDPVSFEQELDHFLSRRSNAPRQGQKLRLACLGNIPLCSNLFETIEELDARVVFNEAARQISMPAEVDSLVEQYLNFTLPYDIATRLKSCEEELSQRDVDGLIFISQCGTSGQIEEIFLRQRFKQPLLALPDLRPGELDGGNRLKLESFIGMLRAEN